LNLDGAFTLGCALEQEAALARYGPFSGPAS
jgi:hypothetical protein